METKDIRLAKLRQIIDDRFGGVAGQCADALGMKRPQLSRWVTKNSDARQGISDESAREIERIFGYPRGWMDGLSPSSSSSDDNSVPEFLLKKGEAKRSDAIAMSDDEKRLISGYRAASRADKEVIDFLINRALNAASGILPPPAVESADFQPKVPQKEKSRT